MYKVRKLLFMLISLFAFIGCEHGTDIIEKDTTKPVITLLGKQTVTILRGNTYKDAGATAEDNIEGDITSRIIQIGNVDTSIADTYTIVYRVEDASKNRAEKTRTVVVVEDIIATNTWHNKTLVERGGNIEALFTVIPLDEHIDSVVGFSKGKADQYSDLGIIIRFANSGEIDARDGSTYNKERKIPYESGLKYTFRLQINFLQHTYHIYVTPEGKEEILLGKNYRFRLEQNRLTTIDNIAHYSQKAESILLGDVLCKEITPPDNIKVIMHDDFEGKRLNKNLWEVTWWTPDGQLSEGIEPEIVSDPVRSGKRAIKIAAEANWNGHKNYSRTELLAHTEDRSFTKFFKHGKEYWLAFSIYLPKNWENDTKSREVLFQLHGNNGAGGKYGVPSLALEVNNDKWHWHVAWEKGDYFDSKEYGSSTLIKGKWVDFKIHVKFSYEQDGILEIWKNAKKYVTRNGPNSYDRNGGYARGPQTGIYKWNLVSK